MNKLIMKVKFRTKAWNNKMNDNFFGLL